MPNKSDRATALPDGLSSLLTQRQLETYYGVSETTVLQWINAGMPVEPMKPANVAASKDPQRKHRRFALAAVKTWHAEGPSMPVR